MKKTRLIMVLVLITLMALVAQGAGAWSGKIMPFKNGSNAPALVGARPAGTVVEVETSSDGSHPIEILTEAPGYAAGSVDDLFSTGKLTSVAPGGIVQIKGSGKLETPMTISVGSKNQADVAYICLSNGTCYLTQVINGVVTVGVGTELPFTVIFGKK